jgi:hypothetical protein
LLKHTLFFKSLYQRWAPALFSRFRAREREAKNSAKAGRKKSAKKSESAERERKKREFFHPTQATRFQSPTPQNQGS